MLSSKLPHYYEHLLQSVQPVDNYPGRLICLHEETHQDLLFICRVNLQPPLLQGKKVEMRFALIQQIHTGVGFERLGFINIVR